jgi:hypothetical protein
MNFLKSYVRKVGEESPGSVLIDENDRFLINRLLNERISKEEIEYLIK